MNENIINSYKDAENFLMEFFGEPDYFSTPENISEIEEYLNMFRDEFDELKEYINRVNLKNIAQYKINRTISLHFLLTAGEDYIGLLHDFVYTKLYEEQLNTLNDDIINDKWQNEYWQRT